MLRSRVAVVIRHIFSFVLIYFLFYFSPLVARFSVSFRSVSLTPSARRRDKKKSRDRENVGGQHSEKRNVRRKIYTPHVLVCVPSDVGRLHLYDLGGVYFWL
jgi:hypothetical protein